jgi:peptide/nickel transport system substrate-binding protein
MARIGIEVDLRSSDLASFIRNVYSNYDFEVTNNYLYMLPDPTVGIQRLYWSENIKKGVPFANVVGYSNPDVDRVLVAAQTEMDVAKRQALFKEFQQIVQRDLPILNLFEMNMTTLYNKRVNNHTIGADGPYASFAEVHLSK